MKLLGLKNSVMVVTVDDEFFDYLNQFIWSLYKTKTSKYIARIEKGKCIILARVIAELFGLNLSNIIDHIDGNIFNNLITNLRAATNQQNQANSKLSKTNTTGYKGVSFDKQKQKYRATIIINKYKRFHIGYYDNPIEAAKAYDNTAREYFGEFACVNFPLDGEQSCHRIVP